MSWKKAGKSLVEHLEAAHHARALDWVKNQSIRKPGDLTEMVADENMILLMSGYPPAIIRKRDRLAYLSSLEKAQLGGVKDDYLTIIMKAVGRSLDIYLKAATGQNAESTESD